MALGLLFVDNCVSLCTEETPRRLSRAGVLVTLEATQHTHSTLAK